MGLVVAVNKTFQSYFNLEHQGVLNPNKKFRPLKDKGTMLQKNGIQEKKMAEVMNEKVLLSQLDTEIRMITKVLFEECISSIPVIDDNYRLRGMITKSDLLDFIMRNTTFESWV